MTTDWLSDRSFCRVRRHWHRVERLIMTTSDDLIRKRTLVGILSLGCLIGGGWLYFSADNEGLQGALLRVGMLLAAFWLAMPTRDRPAAWRVLSSNWALVGAIASGILMPRFRGMFPVFAVLVAVALFVRPRNRNK